MSKYVFHAIVDVVVQNRLTKETESMRSRLTVVVEGRTEQIALANARKARIALYENEYWKVVSMSFRSALTRDITEPQNPPKSEQVAVKINPQGDK